MQILQYAAEIAAVILILELMVVLLIFLGVAGGLAFGVHWVNGKTGPAFQKVRAYAGKGTEYVHTGTSYAALPVIVVRKYGETAGAAAEAMKLKVRQIEAARETSPALGPTMTTSEQPVGARPVDRL